MPRKTCNTCAYYRRPKDIEPCKACRDEGDFLNWRKKPIIPKNPLLRR